MAVPVRPEKNSARAGGLKLRPVDNSGRIQDLRNYSGSFAVASVFSANEIATSVALATWQSSPQSFVPHPCLSSLAADLRPWLTRIMDIRKLLTVSVTHDETVWRWLGGPGRREAAGGQRIIHSVVI